MRTASAMLVVVMLGCTNNLKVPPGIIQQPEMQKILWDMVRADRFSSTYLQSRKDTLDRNRKEAIELYDKVFAYHGITRDEFLKSYQFYLNRPDMLKLMFDSISAQADRKRSEVYDRPKPDSLRHHADSVRKRIFSRTLPH